MSYFAITSLKWSISCTRVLEIIGVGPAIARLLKTKLWCNKMLKQDADKMGFYKNWLQWRLMYYKTLECSRGNGIRHPLVCPNWRARTRASCVGRSLSGEDWFNIWRALTERRKNFKWIFLLRGPNNNFPQRDYSLAVKSIYVVKSNIAAMVTRLCCKSLWLEW